MYLAHELEFVFGALQKLISLDKATVVDWIRGALDPENDPSEREALENFQLTGIDSNSLSTPFFILSRCSNDQRTTFINMLLKDEPEIAAALN